MECKFQDQAPCFTLQTTYVSLGHLIRWFSK